MAVNSEQLEDWADEILESLGRKETSWSVAQVSCPEEGCPPVETIMTDLGVKGPKVGNGVYKIFKPIPEVTKADIESVLTSGGTSHAGHGSGHESGHGGHGGHEHDENCDHGDHGSSGHGAEGHGAGH
mmetsp:Transcript_23268/g.42050  ORF Transcript_23268/g.42050 Transcript_23268/m.42050 type:complete len:128 (+) Transcript_23268:58-441(+)